MEEEEEGAAFSVNDHSQNRLSPSFINKATIHTEFQRVPTTVNDHSPYDDSILCVIKRTAALAFGSRERPLEALLGRKLLQISDHLHQDLPHIRLLRRQALLVRPCGGVADVHVGRLRAVLVVQPLVQCLPQPFRFLLKAHVKNHLFLHGTSTKLKRATELALHGRISISGAKNVMQYFIITSMYRSCLKHYWNLECCACIHEHLGFFFPKWR